MCNHESAGWPMLTKTVAVALAFWVCRASADPQAAHEAPAEQSEPSEAAPTAPSIEEVQSRLKALEASKELADEEKASLIETYGKVLQQLKRRDELSAKADGLERATAEAPEKLKQLRREPAAPTESVDPALDRGLTLGEMLQQLAQSETRLTELQAKLAELQNEPKRRTDRRVEIPKLQEAARQQLKEVSEKVDMKPAASEANEAAEAAHTLLGARQRALQQELRAYDAELAFYDATADLQSARRDQAVVQTKRAQQAVEAWQAAVNERRRLESERQALAARRATVQAHPSVKRLATANADLAAQRQELATKIERAASNADRLDRQIEQLDEQYERLSERVRRAGLTETSGLLMRKHRDDLPSLGEHCRRLSDIETESSSVTLELIDLEEQRSGLADLEPVIGQHVGQLGASVDELEVSLIKEELQGVLTARREFLDALIADTTGYLKKLSELGKNERELIARVRESREFVDERILWIRSATVPHLSDLTALGEAMRWLAARSHWSRAGDAVVRELGTHRTLYASFGLVCGLLAVGHHRLRRRLRTCNQDAAKRFGTSFLPTTVALSLSLMLAIGWPALLWLAGWRLADVADRHEFVAAVGRALQGSALLLLSLEVARQVCRPHGLGESHFDWPNESLKVVRGCLGWLVVGGLPAAWLVLVFEAQSNESWKGTLGRSAFIWSQLLLAWCAHRVWHAPRGFIQELVRNESDVWWRRFKRFWHLATVGGPFALAGLAIGGFYFTAVQLAWWMLLTLWLLFGLIVLHALMLRWVLLAYRELAIRRARERRAAEAAVAAAATAEGKPPLADAGAPEPAVSLPDVNQQTRSVLRLSMCAALFLGTWLIWEGVLPSLGVFNRIELWPNPFTLVDAEVVETGLTLADVILAALIAALTLAAGRNVPGLLELTILGRLSLDAGARYAVGAVSKYAIGVAGIMAAVGQLGIGWSQVQWLAAAVSVGLGFGLQEIFANFVSGLILLFERPIRIGDIVSVADVTGKVSRIRIRATTIIDWDLRELVVPNREFVTGRVMNWTLSDTLARMTLHVGVAYGSDPDLVREILLEIARDHPLVRPDPPPHALLDGFGDSALEFTLRVYMSSLDVSLQLRHELHAQIVAALGRAGIEIPFPQRDLRLRTTPELVSAMGLAAAKPAREVA